MIDAHLHAFASADEGLLAQGGESVAGYSGVLDEVVGILDSGAIDQALVLSTLPVDIWRRLLGPSWPANEVEERLLGMAIAQNDWLRDAVARDARLWPVVGADPTLDSGRMVEHLDGLIRSGAARAIKIHPALNAVPPDHPGYGPIFEFAQEADVPVISHGGGNADALYPSEIEYCAPERFVSVLAAYPRLRIVIAHLAFPYIDDLVDLAARFRNLYSDLSFVIASEQVPQHTLLAAIRSFGIDRVMFGSDFLYTDPKACAARLLDVGLTDGELECVATDNAVHLYRLPGR